MGALHDGTVQCRNDVYYAIIYDDGDYDEMTESEVKLYMAQYMVTNRTTMTVPMTKRSLMSKSSNTRHVKPTETRNGSRKSIMYTRLSVTEFMETYNPVSKSTRNLDIPIHQPSHMELYQQSLQRLFLIPKVKITFSHTPSRALILTIMLQSVHVVGKLSQQYLPQQQARNTTMDNIITPTKRERKVSSKLAGTVHTLQLRPNSVYCLDPDNLEQLENIVLNNVPFDDDFITSLTQHITSIREYNHTAAIHNGGDGIKFSLMALLVLLANHPLLKDTMNLFGYPSQHLALIYRLPVAIDSHNNITGLRSA